MRSLTASEAALRAYHHPTSATCSDNNSDRDSRSTSSQSQCGHHSALVDSKKPQQPQQPREQPRISYISSNDNQMNIAMTLEGHCYQVITPLAQLRSLF